MQLKRDFFLDPSLLLYLPLYKLDGASIMDRSAYGHLCTVTGALWRPKGRCFDGSDDFIHLGSNPSIEDTDISIIAWVNPENFTDRNGIIGRGQVKGTDNKYQGWLLHTKVTTGEVTFLRNVGTTTEYRVESDAVCVADSWNYIAVTYQKSDGETKVWVDTAVKTETESTSDITYEAQYDDGTDIGLHSYKTDTRWYLIGSIGEVWIYNRALTLQEIQRNYLATKWRYV